MKQKTQFVCTECNHTAPRWTGQCSRCGAWNTLEERSRPAHSSRGGSGKKIEGKPVVTLGEIDATDLTRYTTGIEELDRVLGGGLVPGSVILVAGDPGIGKSTLLLQAASAYAERGLKVLYVSAEESDRQLQLRSRRLGRIHGGIGVLAGNRLETIAPIVEGAEADLLIVDSLQTLHHPDVGSAPGSAAQVRDSTLFFVELAKRHHVPVLLVGHVTKEGTVAGPRTVEHMVDAVLYLEGDRYHPYRVLRAAKNRFGPTHEVGLFEMVDAGLREVANPSAFLLEERRPGNSGSAVGVAMEGTRPLLLEIQALVGNAAASSPRRVAMGLDPRRLAVLLAVLERRAGLNFSACDVFANVTGGIRVAEPGVDLALAAAVASSYHDVPLEPNTLLVGEIGLGGEVRRTGQLALRLHEAARLGFRRAVIPARGAESLGDSPLELVPVERIDQALERAMGTVGERKPVSRPREPRGEPRRNTVPAAVPGETA